MTKRPPYARIAITLPPEDLQAADEVARDLDRSRSWVVAEAVRQYVATRKSDPEPTASSEQGAHALPGLGASRLLQLRRDLALTPEERILIAEETLQNAPAVAVVALGSRFFERYEDFLDWKTHRGRLP